MDEESMIEIELRGAPAEFLCEVVSREVVKAGKLKLPYGNGYEHFILDHFDEKDGVNTPVFVWFDRTRVAE